ncbi:unnamed protein product [Tilletia controversa]|uniref:DUF4211 domain-containing protein n=4 Tax=Tilletia TaxID=13289 RepID=A0A8X7MZ81_9BASI|nr:hypothetical protein CF336_g475 [Tilletia laevis]KAE8201102.1 hypothetical protein CF328_g2775 [Tilletia controversa]KAE8265414.1 hypothetical protein A4X03_0g284 [Tilletia caries]KAE8208795.1 hypothetical protein CF335_g153 [Tilletia laevis]KAE8255244.1 hypothetical protein A4X06_0g532 [Tilletia controversa]
MNSSNDLSLAYNRMVEQHRLSGSSNPANFQLRRAATASPGPNANGPSPQRGRLPSASPDLFCGSSQGGSPERSGSASSDSGAGQNEPPNGADGLHLGSYFHDHDPESGGDVEMNSSQPLFREDGDRISMAGGSPYAARQASSAVQGQNFSSPGFDEQPQPGPQLAGQAAIQFRDEENLEADDEDDLWGSPSETRRSPLRDPPKRASAASATSQAGRSAQKKASRPAAASSSKKDPVLLGFSHSKSARADAKKGLPVALWIDVPPISNKLRRQFSIVRDFKPTSTTGRGQRAAAAGAKEKNKKLAELSSKPLIIISDDESGDETKSVWFDPEKRKQSQEQRKRRPDPSRRVDRAHNRLSQHVVDTDSGSDDASSATSFQRLKIDLSQIPTVPTRMWGTPPPEDAIQGLRAAPRDGGDGGPSATQAGNDQSTSNIASPPKPAPKKAPKKPQGPEHSFEELFMQHSSTSSDEVEVLPSGGRSPAKGKTLAMSTSETRRPSPHASNGGPANGRAASRIQEESDDEFHPIERPAGTSKEQPRASTSKGKGAAARPVKSTAGTAAGPATGPNQPRFFPKPAIAPLPAIPMKLPANMHPPTGRVLSREEYAKEDRPRKRRSDANGGGKTAANGRKRQHSSDSERGPSPQRGHRGGRDDRHARSDSDDFEVTASHRAVNRSTPPPGSRPKARAFSSGGRGRRDSLSPPRRYSGGGSARRRDRSITPSSASETERTRRRKGGSGDKSKNGPSRPSSSSNKAGPGRSFVMPDSQPPRKKLKPFTMSRDKILGAAEGRKSQNDGNRASGSQSRSMGGGGMDYGAAGDDSDDEVEMQPGKSSPSKARRQSREAGSDDEDVRKRAPKSLQSQINEDAWVYTSGTHKKDVYREDLSKLRKAREKVLSQRASKGKGKEREREKRKGKKRAETSDSETSDSFAASTGESSLSSESRLKNKASLNDFVIDDDDEPVESLVRRVPRQLSGAAPPRRSGDRDRRSPPRSKKSSSSSKRRSRPESFSEDDSIEESGEGEREMQPSDYIRLERERMPEEALTMSLDDAYWWEMVWLIMQLLDQKLPPEDARSASHARRIVKERMSDGQRQLQTMAQRKNFLWYLKTYPKLIRMTLTNDELQARIDRFGSGCGMCPRKKQRPDSRICLFGRPYGPDLNVRDKSEISSSDCDSDQSTELKETGFEALQGKGKKNFTAFFLGSKCAVRAELLHRVLHWEVLAQDEAKRLSADRLDDWVDRPLRVVLTEVQDHVNGKWPAFKKYCEAMREEAMDFVREGG